MDNFKSQIQEVVNRNALVTIALKHGYNAFLPVYDGGVDFILYRETDGDLKKVQLKGRWYIDRKYQWRDIWIAFNDGQDWYLAPHDRLVEIGSEMGFTNTSSWLNGGAYSCPSLSAAMRAALESYKWIDPSV